MKKSLEKVTQDAIRMSELNPGVTYHIMDKKGKKAGVYISECLVRLLIINGFHIVLKYRRGREIQED